MATKIIIEAKDDFRGDKSDVKVKIETTLDIYDEVMTYYNMGKSYEKFKELSKFESSRRKEKK